MVYGLCFRLRQLCNWQLLPRLSMVPSRISRLGVEGVLNSKLAKGFHSLKKIIIQRGLSRLYSIVVWKCWFRLQKGKVLWYKENDSSSEAESSSISPTGEDFLAAFPHMEVREMEVRCGYGCNMTLLQDCPLETSDCARESPCCAS